MILLKIIYEKYRQNDVKLLFNADNKDYAVVEERSPIDIQSVLPVDN